MKSYKIVKVETKFESYAMFEIEFTGTLNLNELKRQVRIIKAILEDEKLNVDYLVTDEVINLMLGKEDKVFINGENYLTYSTCGGIDKLIVWKVTQTAGTHFTTMVKQ